MLKCKIELTGETVQDLFDALYLIKKQIAFGIKEDSNSNETGSYDFEVKEPE